MTISYDTLGGSIDIEPSGAVTAGDLNRSVAIVGSADTTDGTASVGEPAAVTSGTEAVSAFGTGTELAIQSKLALANGASTVYGVAAETTAQTEAVTAQSSGTLSGAPIADPRVTAESLSVTDGNGDTVTVEYTDVAPTAPSDSNTVEVNPTTGGWAASSSGDYNFDYATVAFDTAINAAVGEAVRYVAVCTEADTPTNTLVTALGDQAADFRFSRGIVGIGENVPGNQAADYTPDTDDFRLIEVAPSYGTTTNGNAARLCGAMAGLAAKQSIDVTGSITYDELIGFDSLAVAYAPSQAQQFDRVTAVTDTMEIAEGVTTATESAFADIYKAEIIDYTVEQIHERITDYRGGSNANSARQKFRSRLKRTLSSLSAPNAQPPLLADGEGGRPYALDVSLGDADTETGVTIGIDPAPIAKQVNINVSVGPLQFNGVDVDA
ncbi:hypothetical protein EXE44_05000 [Halorubrum sp. SS7]|uniref:hypothetical protein n=2 Tax=unclassified Halorubrum TaxID=2642239 RepID=UPI0010F65358|nr:hypothetical protein [Halorubrum sp. SS7]TKX58905.1 hypothetical protein EXE44_05000 [Halorubrum sp. SS7]